MAIDGYDVISAGGDDRRTPQLGPRSKRAGAVALALGLLGFAGWRVIGPAGGDDPAALATSPATAAPDSRQPGPGSAPAPRPVPAPTGPALGEPSGIHLLMSGSDQLVEVDLDHGTSLGIAVPGTIRRVLKVAGGEVVLSEDQPVGPPLRPDRTPVRTAFFVPRSRTSIVAIGQARTIVAAARDDRIWLADPDPDAPRGRMIRVDLAGGVDANADLGPHRTAVRESAAGMVTTFDKYFSRSLELWDWRTSKLIDTYFVGDDVVVTDADAGHVAYTLPYCARPGCRLRVVGTAGTPPAAEVEVETPPGWSTEVADFSPDGTQIAMLGRILRPDDSSAPALLIADVRTGTTKAIAGLESSPERYARLAWSPDARWLFATAARAGAPLLGYQQGENSVRLVPDPIGPADASAGAPTGLAAY